MNLIAFHFLPNPSGAWAWAAKLFVGARTTPACTSHDCGRAPEPMPPSFPEPACSRRRKEAEFLAPSQVRLLASAATVQGFNARNSLSRHSHPEPSEAPSGFGARLHRVFASLRLCDKPRLAVIVLLLATFAHARTSQLLFDLNGNLFVQ